MKLIYIAVGVIAMAIGAVGVILPVLPTTPFLLLAAFCFAKGSKKFHRWFLSTKLYQKHLESFVKNRSMKRSTKLGLLAFASSMLILAMVMMPNDYGRLFLLALMCFKYYYFIFRIQTIPSGPREQQIELGEAA